MDFYKVIAVIEQVMDVDDIAVHINAYKADQKLRTPRSDRVCSKQCIYDLSLQQSSQKWMHTFATLIQVAMMHH